MSDDFTPDTEEVRESYQSMGDGLDFKRRYNERGEEFDRWLAALIAEHERVLAERAAPPEWEYGAIYQADNGIELRWFSMDSGAFTVRGAAEHEVARFADAQIVLGRRTKPGPWEPLPEDANQTNERSKR